MEQSWIKPVQLRWAGNCTKQRIHKMLSTLQKESLFWWTFGSQHKAPANA